MRLVTSVHVCVHSTYRIHSFFFKKKKRVKHHIGLEKAFGSGGGAVVGHFDEDGHGETDTLASRDDETWLLNKFHRLPPGVAGNGLV